MTDLISRQDAIKEAYTIIIDGELFDVVQVETLEGLPSAQQWIPCSERLPKEKDGRVLITLEGEVTTAIYSEFSNTWYIGDMCGVGNRVPTAWMERPKPYEGEKR